MRHPSLVLVIAAAVSIGAAAACSSDPVEIDDESTGAVSSVGADAGHADSAVALDAEASDGGHADAAADEDGGPGEDASAPVASYSEVAPILARTCATCHGPKFDTLAKVKALKAKMTQVISSGRMPKGNPGWKDTADGQTVLEFLTESSELN